MTFVLSDLKPTTSPETHADFSFDFMDGGCLTIDFVIKDDPAFKSALTKVYAKLQGNDSLNKNTLKRENQAEINEHEALLYVMGEYCIATWSVIDTKGKAITPNGDNLLAVLNSFTGDDEVLAELLQGLITTFNEAMTKHSKKVKQHQDKVNKTAKKPLKSGSTKAK